MEIENKYEIIAIFREHIKIKGRVIKINGHDKKDIQFIKINHDHITVCNKENEISADKFSCEIYCSLGLVIFELKKEKNSDSFDIICRIPKKVTIIQRRTSPRIYFDENSNHTGTGRLKNGVMYKFKIKDISDGGCALVSDIKEIKLDTILRHVKLDFCEFGWFTTTLKVKKVSVDGDFFRISCQFQFRDESEKSRIEGFFINLKLTQGRKRY